MSVRELSEKNPPAENLESRLFQVIVERLPELAKIQDRDRKLKKTFDDFSEDDEIVV